MKNKQKKIKNKNDIFFLTLKQKNDKIEFTINCQSNFPSLCYEKEFSLNDLQKISKFFQLFDSIDECYSDLKKKFDDNNYEILLHEIKEKIIIKIKTNIVNKDFVIDIPIKKLEQEKTYYKFISSKPNNNYNYYDDEESSQLNYFEKIDEYIDKKLNFFNNIFNSKLIKKKNDIENENEDEDEIQKVNKNKRKRLFEKSTIIENDYERRLIESFIKENDKTKTEICPVLLFKSSVDGDDSKKFHEKCDYYGATLILVRSEQGKRFGGHTSVSWDKNLGNYLTKGDNFLFSLDTRKYYKNISGGNHTYHNSGYGPTFGAGHDLYISNGCMSNQNSYTNKSSYDMTSNYELNGGVYQFKVLDYEVFKI